MNNYFKYFEVIYNIDEVTKIQKYCRFLSAKDISMVDAKKLLLSEYDIESEPDRILIVSVTKINPGEK